MQIDITKTGQTNLSGIVDDFSVDSSSTDGPLDQKETFYDNPDFTKWYGYYKEIPELKKAIDSFATWVLGKGFVVSARDQVILDSITGRGDEDFLSILWNMKVIAKVNGDSYAEIIRDDNGILINIKPLSPENIRITYNREGIIVRYTDKRTDETFTPDKILHFTNDRVANEMGGTSVLPVVQWAIDARNEAMADWKRVSHRSTIRVLYVDEDDVARRANLRKDYAEAINKGEVLIIPAKKEDASFEDLQLPPVEAFLAWIRYLENFIYIAVGIPKVIMGSVESIPESGGKMSYVTYQQIYERETREMESDIWNQLAIRITFNRPADITEGVSDTANKNQAQTGFQPSDTKVTQT